MSEDSNLRHKLVSELKRLTSELGKVPTVGEFVKASGISERQITKHFGGYSPLVLAAGLTPNRPGGKVKVKTENSDQAIIELPTHSPNPPKILILDIETAAIEARTWGTWQQNIGENQIIKDWFVMSYCAKFLGEEKIYYLDQRYTQPVEDDRMLMEAIHHLICQADIVVAHNGKRFDLPKLKTRFLKYGLGPTLSYRIQDTLSIARRHFKITKNTLKYLAKFLGVEVQKDDHSEFPGMELWNECVAGNMRAWECMEKYNLTDVLVLEEVYKKLAPWDNSINFSMFYEQNKCLCGSSEFQDMGYRVTNSGKFKRVVCTGCRKEFVLKGNLIDKDLKGMLYKH